LGYKIRNALESILNHKYRYEQIDIQEAWIKLPAKSVVVLEIE